MQSEVMFEVDAVLAAPEIIMKPTANEIYNIMVHSMKDFLERYANIWIAFLITSFVEAIACWEPVKKLPSRIIC